MFQYVIRYIDEDGKCTEEYDVMGGVNLSIEVDVIVENFETQPALKKVEVIRGETF